MLKQLGLKLTFLMLVLMMLLTSCFFPRPWNYYTIIINSASGVERVISKEVIIVTDGYQGDANEAITVRMYANETLLSNVEKKYDTSTKQTYFFWRTARGCSDLPQGNHLFRYEMYNAKGEIVQQASKRAIINNCGDA